MTPPINSTPPGLREIVTDALRYWEPRRLLYNAILTTIVLGYFLASWPGTKDLLAVKPLLGLFVLAVLANVAYCACYIVDVFIQLSSFRTAWRRLRWILFVVGTLFAVAVVTQFFA